MAGVGETGERSASSNGVQCVIRFRLEEIRFAFERDPFRGDSTDRCDKNVCVLLLSNTYFEFLSQNYAHVYVAIIYIFNIYLGLYQY